MSGRYELVSLSSESGKHLSSVVLSNYNYINILLYDSIPTNLSYLSNILSTIRNSIFNSLKLLVSTNDILCDTHSITSSNSDIICRFTCVLNDNKSKLKDLHQNLLNLSDSYGYFNYLKNQLQTIIDCSKDTNGLNSKLSQIVEKFKSSLSEFAKIEPLLNSTKSTIYEIKKAKDQLMASTSAIPPEHLKSVYFQMNFWSSNIDIMFRAIQGAEINTWCLKYWICKFINLDSSNNLLNRLLFSDKILDTDIDEICSFIKCLYSCISEISKICNSDCKCECTCNCVAECTGNTICLCLCNSTKTDTAKCCICICKKQDNPKCICICIFKNGEQGCASGEHECKKCLLKLDIGTLKDQTLKILNNLRFIRCFISRLENKSCSRPGNNRCCSCSCSVVSCANQWLCEPYCCCNQRHIDYLSIISRIDLIEYLFKEVSKEVLKLTKMNKTLKFYSTNVTKCEVCESSGCKEKIDSLIKNIEKAAQYYSSFAYIIGDIKAVVEYKVFYPNSLQVLNMLTLSVRPSLNQLGEINNKLICNADYTRTSDQILFYVYSHYNVLECYLLISNLSIYSSKLSMALYINQWIEICDCVKEFKANGESFKTTDFYKYLMQGSINIHKLKNLITVNDSNHLCLCLVVKYVLYPNLIKSMYYLRGLYLMDIGNLTREFLTNNYILMNINHKTKLLFIIIDVIYRLSRFIDSGHTIVKFYCFCQLLDTKYYHLIVNLILYVSSLIENTWSMDTESVKMATEKISSLLAEYQSLHVYTNYGSSKSNDLYVRISGHYNPRTVKGVGVKNGAVDVLYSKVLKSYKFSFNNISGHVTSFMSIIRKLNRIKDQLNRLYQIFSTMSFQINIDGTYTKIKINRGINIYVSNLYIGMLKQMSSNSGCKKEEQCKCGVMKIYAQSTLFSFLYSKLKSKINMNEEILYIIDLLKKNKFDEYMKLMKTMADNYINHNNMTIEYIKSCLKMLKNTQLTSNNYPNLNTKNSIESRNWGYDTQYEFQVTTNHNNPNDATNYMTKNN